MTWQSMMTLVMAGRVTVVLMGGSFHELPVAALAHLFPHGSADAFRGLHDALDGSVRVVIQIVNAHRATETAAAGLHAAVVVDEIGAAFEINDSLMHRVAIARELGKQSARGYCVVSGMEINRVALNERGGNSGEAIASRINQTIEHVAVVHVHRHQE